MKGDVGKDELGQFLVLNKPLHLVHFRLHSGVCGLISKVLEAFPFRSQHLKMSRQYLSLKQTVDKSYRMIQFSSNQRKLSGHLFIAL